MLVSTQKTYTHTHVIIVVTYARLLVFGVHLYQFVPYCNVQNKIKRERNERFSRCSWMYGIPSAIHFALCVSFYLGWHMILACFPKEFLPRFSIFAAPMFEFAFVKSMRQRNLSMVGANFHFVSSYIVFNVYGCTAVHFVYTKIHALALPPSTATQHSYYDA